ncbi:K+-transporting ATPase ATPase B chain [Panacagrimonas perspica]|uniref:Potassium-transporting ATPase ATP-binding subunit n=1 Tax=Panacagrimonas perspica TaxID=381431 RepID=A0A4V3F5F6_9GAMM|nr:potassium-transporting ATPase subunit KdpB [Panacagrimonas perspica]TDU28846.1 K+-transporting ATPase ATPase B chain [Panacagrimonas perspica]THD02323.1 potassium-transporting ATPase subunit B [Panacagrimonas perspica]
MKTLSLTPNNALWLSASQASLRKLDPRAQLRNPVMFVVWIGAVFVSVLWLRDLFGDGDALWSGQIALWLWFTVLFANFSESLAEGRGKARADSLRSAKGETEAKKVQRDGKRIERVSSRSLRAGDIVLVEAGDNIPGDGEVIEGIATVNEAAVTGESAPVLRESGGDRSSVTGGTKVVSDWIKVRITANPGESFLDRMIGLVEGAARQKTPNELALSVLLTGLTLIFLMVAVTLPFFAHYSGGKLPVTALIALLVTLIPTTIGGLLSAIGIAGMDRLVRANVIAKSGRAVEAAGDVDVLLLDKTGTITYGNRMAEAFLPAPGVDEVELTRVSWLSSLSDGTAEGRSIVELAKRRLGDLGSDAQRVTKSVEFTAQTRLSGADLDDGTELRKGAVQAVITYAFGSDESHVPPAFRKAVERIAESGGTPLAVAVKQGGETRLLGAIHLKDVVKPGIRARFAELRAMGIRTVMITGDNPLTAASIAAEAGVDDFLAEATPERKLELIRKEQQGGRMVAMCGDGTNDAPALAQADVGVAMNDGTPAAKEAANLVDLDSDPTKLIQVVEIGKQLLISRGSLTTFSIANDIAKYFAILPALFVSLYPQLAPLDVMRLHSPQSAILSAIIFNALIIVALIPLALRGVRYAALSASALLRRNLLIYGLGGIVVPFVGIKLIDVLVSAVGLA